MDKADLNKYRGLNCEVRQLSGWLKELDAGIYSPGGQRFSRTPSGPVEKTMDDLIEKHDKLINLYIEKIVQIHNQILKIELAVDKLDPAERALLRFRYFSGYSWERIAKEMGYCVRNVYRLHGTALVHLREK